MLNKKEAIAYAQITLNYMQSSKYDGEINSDTFGIEMKQAFRIYPRSIVVNIAESQCLARKNLQIIKTGLTRTMGNTVNINTSVFNLVIL